MKYLRNTRKHKRGIVSLAPFRIFLLFMALCICIIPVLKEPAVTQRINIINTHSHPQTGENWEVLFATHGEADLKIILQDQESIEDDKFVSLACNGEPRAPEILAGDVISYARWSCDGVGKVLYHAKGTRKHTIRFEFADQTAYAHNNPSSSTKKIKDITKQPNKEIYKVPSSCVNETDEVIIGDEKNPNAFKPKIKFTKWNKEDYLAIRYDDMNGTPTLEAGNKLKLADKSKEFYFYKADEENFKFGLIFIKKPSTNTFTFYLEGWEEFDFFYQPPLKNTNPDGSTWEDNSTGGKSHRPAEVNGSYAVYHKTKKDHVVGQTNYKNGKFAHIYRPKFIDAEGNWVWADMRVEKGIYEVTIPLHFLDNAKYPVTGNDTIGDTNGGATTDTSWGLQGTQATLPVSGYISGISAQLLTSTSATYTGGIWADSSGSPGSRVVLGAGVAFPASQSYVQSVVSPTVLLSAGNYWIGGSKNEGTTNHTSYYDSSTPVNSVERESTYSTPDPFGSGTSRSGRRYAVYVTYTPLSTANVYYSVGQNTSDHKTGSPTMTMTSGVATFSVAQTATNMGVGDRVTYNGSTVAYISGKMSSTQWRLVTKTGATPTDVDSAQTVNSIAHEYTSLNAAMSGATDSNHLNTTDLVTGNYVLNIACYYDSGADTTAATIGSGYTTGANNYIKIYTPTNTSTECNQSQRHAGKWNDSRYRMAVPTYTTSITIGTETLCARIDGIQIDHPQCNNGQDAITANYLNSSEIWISNCIIKYTGSNNAQTAVSLNGNSNAGQSATYKLYNNIIYDFSTTDSIGIVFGGTGGGTAYIYSNTVYNCNTGILRNNGTLVAKNNLVNGSGTNYSGTFDGTSTNNLSQDATAPPYNTYYTGKTVSFVSTGGKDFHLASSDTLAKDLGTSLSSDSNLAFSTDIDGQSRPCGSAWDIGADEVAAAQVYYSVGQNTSDHKTGSPNISITSGVATFDVAQTATNMGVGDRVTYQTGSNHIVYLASKITTTQWNVVTVTGGTPADHTSTNVISIRHEFTSLYQAVGFGSVQAADSSHLNTGDLVSGNYILNIPCYYDSGAESISGYTEIYDGNWTTGPNNYIRIYTPTDTSTEVNQSQRHAGKWDDNKYSIQCTPTASSQSCVDLRRGYIKVDGLQIKVSSSYNDTSAIGGSYISSGWIEISNNIIWGQLSTSYAEGLAFSYQDYNLVLKIWNNIIYGIRGTGSGTSQAISLNLGYSTPNGTAYIYNNTIYSTAATYCGGINVSGGTFVAKNNLVYGTGSNYGGSYDGSSTNNYSDTGGAPGSNPKTGTVTFKDANNQDFRLLSSDTGAMEQGADLSGDANLAFSTDIEGESRPFGTYWDIGADEYRSPTAVFFKSFSATEYEGKVLLQWKTGYEANNLGFNVYREDDDGQLARINPELITGGALLAGSGTATAGHSYAWWDNERSAISDQPSALKYWLEDIDLSGKRTMNGPVIAAISSEPPPERAQAALLSQVSRGQSEKDKIASRLRALQTRLGKTLPSAQITPTFTPWSTGTYSTGQALPPPGGGTGWGGLSPQSSIGAIRSPVPGPPSAEIVVPGVDTGNKTGTPSSGSPGLSDRPGTIITLPSGQTKKLTPQEVQWALAAWPAIKLFIQEEGWYRVSQPELLAAGLDPRVNPRNLQLYADGQEQAIAVNVRQEGHFGSQDAIEFYGTGLDTPFTETRVYWLVAGAKPGKRINPPLPPFSKGGLGGFSFPFPVEQKPRNLYIAAVKNGDESNFFGPMVWTTPVEQVLSVSHLDPAALGATTLEVSLRGGTEGSHQVRVLLNNTEVGSLAFTGQSQGVATLSVSQSLLVEGENRVSLVAQGGEMDVSLIDYIRLTYWHTYRADSDRLRFTAIGGQQVFVDGFSSSAVRVVDMTDPKMVQEVVSQVQPQGLGYGVQFVVPGTGPRTLLAFTGSQVKSVAAVEANQPSRWYQAGWGADLVMISHGSLIDSVRPLKALRESQGLSVALIDVEDLYDEFGFGNKSPQALRDFLLRARVNWQKPPRFVLLVGGASFDPRNYLGLGNFDLVPTKLMDTVYLETASDDWFVDFHGDGVPQMGVGRLPVRTVEEANIVVSKIVGYEQAQEKMGEVMLVADRAGNGDFDFEGASTSVEALLGGNLAIRKVFRSQFADDTQVHGALLQGLNGGELLVNYIGHGSQESWRGDIFTSVDAGALTNGLRLPFVVSMTCLNGFFQDVYSESLAEALLKARQGGAVAVWTSSGLTEPDKQAVMNKELVRLLFNGESLTLGEAVKRAKAAVSDQDVRRTWILFGDPTTRLRY